MQPGNTSNSNFRARRLKRIVLLIIDEVGMLPSHALRVLRQLLAELKNMTEHDDPEFAGLTILMGGDLRQLSPICGEGELESDIHFRFSDVLKQCHVMSLEQNMRAAGAEQNFTVLLKQVGEGRQPSHPALPPNSMIVPDEWVIESGKTEDLINWCFGDDPSTEGEDCTILTHLNQDCREINNKVNYAILCLLYVI